jgi:hypothetical protein
MNWPLAIARNRSALLAVVAAIVALIGGREGGPIARHIRNAALALLRPAESAARRLIVISARGLAVAPRLPRAFSDALRQRLAARDGSASAGMSRPPAFRLFDRRKRFGRIFRPLKLAGTPRIRTFRDSGASIPAAPPVFRQAQDECGGRTDPNALVDAGRLRLRTAALQRALADLPHQARRLARWRARGLPGPGARVGSPLRLGHPPGWRRRADRGIDHVLRECHLLACDALASGRPAADTS